MRGRPHPEERLRAAEERKEKLRRKASSRSIIHHLAMREAGAPRGVSTREIILSGRDYKYGKRPEDYIKRIEQLRLYPPRTGTKRNVPYHSTLKTAGAD